MSDFLDEVISDYGTGINHRFVDIEKLPCSVIKEFAAICMENSDDEMIFITETDQTELTTLMISHLKKDDDDSLFDLDEYISMAAIRYYKPQIKELLAEKLDIQNAEGLIDSGYESYVDRDNGETHWINGSRRVQL
jgi:hypothetical protein